MPRRGWIAAARSACWRSCGPWRLTLPCKPRIVMRMNQVILAYSWLPRQLPAGVRAHWRARLQSGAAPARLSSRARTQSQSLLGVALACRLLSGASGRASRPRSCAIPATANRTPRGCRSSALRTPATGCCAHCPATGAVGVDIEPAGAARGTAALADGVRCAGARAARSARAALSIWTTKEAALKAAGGPLAELAARACARSAGSNFAAGAGIAAPRASRRA